MADRKYPDAVRRHIYVARQMMAYSIGLFARHEGKAGAIV
jgi:hypothetical protein